MRLTFSLLTLFLIFPFTTRSQSLLPEGGGEYRIVKTKACIQPEDRQEIREKLDRYKRKHRKQRTNSKILPPALSFPLEMVGTDYNDYYAVSNYVDHDPAYSGSQYGSTNEDYNCGNRTYDTNGGYNHQGVDWFTYPFPWDLYERNAVHVVAAADGIIIGKDDGNDDMNCSCNGQWNAVYIEHSDGSEAWYGHLKKNSLTSKAIGSSVVQGEYLGVLASSGCSTGPHLHFEVYNSNGELNDPFSGPCNTMNSNSWWANQPNYSMPRLLAAFTHDAPPVFGCPSINETPNRADSFSSNSNVVYFASYFRDRTANTMATYRILEPNGNVFQSWQHTHHTTFIASYWYWFFTLPTSGPFGNWEFEVTYNGETVTYPFTYYDEDCVTPGTNTYIGPNGGNWHDSPTYWSRGIVPKHCDNVVIPNGASVTVFATNVAECFTLDVEVGGTLTVMPGAVVDVQTD